jgi:hypothetical protein
VRAVASVDVPVARGTLPSRQLDTLTDLVFSDMGFGQLDRILTLGEDFAALGYRAGTVFAVRGSAANDGLYTVAEVKEEARGSGQFNVLVLSAAALAPEGDAGTPATAVLLRDAAGFTVEAWVKFEDYAEGEFPPKWEAVVTKGQAWALSRYSNTGRITFSTWTGSAYHDVVSIGDLEPRRWHHLAGVYDGATKSLYIDGTLAAAAAWAGPLLCDDHALELGNAPVLDGDTRLKAGRALNGGLDVVRLWSVARTPEELTAVMRRRLRGSEAGLLGEWRFDETPGGVHALSALDSSMNGHLGALEDLDRWASRVSGSDDTLDPPEPLAVLLGAALDGTYALQLNGTDQYVEVTNEVIFDFTTGFALELWVTLDALPAPGAEAALMSKGPAAYELVVDAGGLLVFRTGGALTHVLRGITALEPGQWHHVAAIWDAGVKTLMLDGAIDAEAYGVPSPVAQNDLPLCFGARPLAGGSAEAFLAGFIDELRAWAYARTADQIAQNMNRTLTGREPGLAGWWPLDEGEGPIAGDAKEVVPKPGSLMTLQFEQLAFAGNEIKRYPSTYVESSTNPAIDPEGAADNVFMVENSLVAPDSFAVKGEAMLDYPGSTALFNGVPNADTILRMLAGEKFRLVSIEVGDLNNGTPPGTQVTFRAVVSGMPLERTFELNGGDTVPELFELLRFNSVAEVRWRQTYPYHLFDNIVVQRLRDLLPSHLKADAILHNLPNWARVDSPLVFGDPVPPQYALRFDGNGDWVSVDPPSGQNSYFRRRNGTTPLPFTLEVWLRPGTLFAGSGPNHTAPFQTIVRQGDVGWGLAVDAAGYLRYWIADDQASSLASDRPLDPGVWQHVALLVDPATNTVAFFINGAPAGEHEVSIVSVDTANHALVWGRKGAATAGGWFTGDLDEIRLWNYARDPDEIYAFANRQLPDGMSGLLGYWRLNDGIGDTAVDSSGNDLTAILHGTTASPDLPEWIYGPQPPNRDGMWALQFDGVDDYLMVEYNSGLNPSSGGITLEAWVKPAAKASSETSADELYRTILMQGKGGYGLAISRTGELVFWPGAGSKSVSAARVADGIWQHVAVTCTGDGGPVLFYLNGAAAGHGPISELLGSIDTGDTGPLLIGRQGLGKPGSPAAHHYKGYLDEVRIWDGVRTPAEVAQLAGRQLFRWDGPELIGYWNFNRFDPAKLVLYDPEVNYLQVPSESAGGYLAVFGEDVMDVSAYVPGLYSLTWDGDFWDNDRDDQGDFSRDPGTRGLWVGDVVFTAVNEVQTAKPGQSGVVTPVASPLSFVIILHVDNGGRVRLLKEVTIMQHPGGQTDVTIGEEGIPEGVETQIALVTDDTLLPAFIGVLGQDGSRAGHRIGTVAYDFEGSELRLSGGLGAGKALTGTVLLPRLHPTNPFRHKYHPDHRNTNPDNPKYGYEISRKLNIVFAATANGQPTVAGYGVSQLTGTYEESITGLHKVPLIARGTIAIRRVSTVGTLND